MGCEADAGAGKAAGAAAGAAAKTAAKRAEERANAAAERIKNDMGVSLSRQLDCDFLKAAFTGFRFAAEEYVPSGKTVSEGFTPGTKRPGTLVPPVL